MVVQSLLGERLCREPWEVTMTPLLNNSGGGINLIGSKQCLNSYSLAVQYSIAHMLLMIKEHNILEP